LSSTGGYKFRGSTPLSYSRAREVVLSAFASIGLPKQEYGLHSFRAGGASAAANAKIKDRLFKRHGRWKSDRANDGYIKDDIESLLSVSRSLGIQCFGCTSRSLGSHALSCGHTSLSLSSGSC
jgi:hypothetical protein